MNAARSGECTPGGLVPRTNVWGDWGLHVTGQIFRGLHLDIAVLSMTCVARYS